MERISFIVERLNMAPFRKGFATMADLDSKSSLELLEITCEIVVEIDPDQKNILLEQTENKVHRIIQFLLVMKFNIPEEQMEDFHSMMLSGDIEVLHTVMHWCLQRLDHLKKRAYLGKYLMPLDVPSEFLNEDLIIELSQSLKEMQIDFKEVHKTVDQLRGSGTKPAELKAEITQLEQERTQLQAKIQRMKKDAKNEGSNFEEMLKVQLFLCHFLLHDFGYFAYFNDIIFY
jgi:intraflagellar transport protein 81